MNLVLRSEKAGNLYELTGIPTDVWDAFVKIAQSLFPDTKNADEAAAKALASFITSATEGESRTLLLTGIPVKKYEAFKGASAEAGLTEYRLIAEMIQAAEDRRLIITSPRDDKEIEKNRVLVFFGFPAVVWNAWETISKKLEEIKPGEYPVIMNMLEFLLQFPKVAQITANKTAEQSPAGDFQWTAQSPKKST